MSASMDPVGRTCPHCGSIVTSEDFFCRACYRRFELRGAETDPTKRIPLPESSVLTLRSPVLAVILSFAAIGLGQFYNGDLAKGLAFSGSYLAAACLPIMQGDLASPYLFLIMAVVWGVSLVDAPVSAWRINRLAKEFSGGSFLFWVECTILAGLLWWYITRGHAWFWADLMCPAVRFFL